MADTSPPGPSKQPAAEAPTQRGRPTSPPNPPWRTEGLPAKPGVQDQMNGPRAISYSEFDRQVEAGNVAEVFARGHTIQGELQKPKPLPDKQGNT
jgi:hypothetical protein